MIPSGSGVPRERLKDEFEVRPTRLWREPDSNRRFLMKAGPNARVINLSAMAICAMALSCNVAMEVGIRKR